MAGVVRGEPGFQRLEPGREPPWRAIAAFITAMTDRHAIRTYEEIFLPRPWMVI